MTTYLVPASYAEIEYIEKKSRFIGRVWPVESEAEALACIEKMRKQHYDATHNVYAYVIDENNIFRYSDDNEPSGTAGMPVLDTIRKEGIVDVCVVVTRYFGGTLLGTGGLVHAYGADYCAVYAVIAPVTALLNSKVKAKRCVAHPELGMEAFYELQVEEFPCIIAAAHGESMF